MPAATAGLFEGFMGFPVPLALTDFEGRPQLVNARFREQFGAAVVDPDSVRQLADADRITVRLRGGPANGAEVAVKPVSTEHGKMLIFSELFADSVLARLVSLQERVDALERLAATDHLTGAWNRAHLDRIIPVEIARSASSRQPLSLILLDVDHFKNVNDTFGHATGDIVLQELAERIRGRLRPSDMLFRWGGEEFLVLVAAAGYRNAEVVASALRALVADRHFSQVGRVTISLGVAEHLDRESAGQWFERLDAALYAAKAAGRNRVVVDRRGNSDAWAAQPGAGLPHLVWQEGYASGNAVIDAEHQTLFECANRLIDAAAATPAEPNRFQQCLESLLDHIRRHFSDEEAILAEHHYDQLDQHKRAHAGLLRRAGALKGRAEKGEAGLGAVVEFLAQDVVARHLLTVDRAFFPLFTDAA